MSRRAAIPQRDHLHDPRARPARVGASAAGARRGGAAGAAAVARRRRRTGAVSGCGLSFSAGGALIALQPLRDSSARRRAPARAPAAPRPAGRRPAPAATASAAAGGGAGAAGGGRLAVDRRSRRTPRPTSTPHRKIDDRDDRRRHEQEDELLPAQLNLVEAVVGRVVCQLGHAYALFGYRLSRLISSIGSGKMIVEFFSDAISVSVCR